MRLSLLIIAAAALPSMAAAQPQTETTPPTNPPAPAAGSGAAPAAAAGDVKINQLIVYGEDPCPQSTADTINICGRMPESERFRIPPDLRDNPPAAVRDSWSNKAVRLEMAGRTGIASCSPVGPGAGAGCLTQLIREAREEWGSTGVDWNRLITEAREERLGRIDKESEEIEASERAAGR